MYMPVKPHVVSKKKTKRRKTQQVTKKKEKKTKGRKGEEVPQGHKPRERDASQLVLIWPSLYRAALCRAVLCNAVEEWLCRMGKETSRGDEKKSLSALKHGQEASVRPYIRMSVGFASGGWVCPLPFLLLLLLRRPGCDAPITVKGPGTLLAILAAVLGPPAPTALGKLAGELLPLPALVVGALPDAATRIVFPTEVPHDDTGPVLHVLAVMPHCELLHEREEVEVVRKKVFFLEHLFLGGNGLHVLAVQHSHLLSNLQPRNQVALEEV